MERNTKTGITCRLCLAEVTSITRIFTTTNVSETSSLQMKIMELANVQVFAGDGLPCGVCIHCSKLVDSYHAFKVQIEKSDAILRHQLSVIQTDPLSVDDKVPGTPSHLENNGHEELVKAEAIVIKDEQIDDDTVEVAILQPSVELVTNSPNQSQVPSPAPPSPDMSEDMNMDDHDVDDDDAGDDEMDPLGEDLPEADSSSVTAAPDVVTSHTEMVIDSTGVEEDGQRPIFNEKVTNLLFETLTKGSKKKTRSPKKATSKSPRKASVKSRAPTSTVTSEEFASSSGVPSATVTSGSLINESIIDSMNEPGPSTSQDSNAFESSDVNDDDSKISIRKRKRFTLEDKMRIIQRMESGESCAQICRALYISNSTVLGIWKHRVKVREQFQKLDPNTMRLRVSDHKDLDDALFAWTQLQLSRGISVNGIVLLSKANELATQLNKRNFSCSTSWIQRFRRRHCIR